MRLVMWRAVPDVLLHATFGDLPRQERSHLESIDSRQPAANRSTRFQQSHSGAARVGRSLNFEATGFGARAIIRSLNDAAGLQHSFGYLRLHAVQVFVRDQ